MKFMRTPFTLSLTVTLWGSTQVNARPQPGEELVARAVNCKAVTGVLGAVKALGAPATSFCSSYLNVPATTTIKITTRPTKYASTS